MDFRGSRYANSKNSVPVPIVKEQFEIYDDFGATKDIVCVEETLVCTPLIRNEKKTSNYCKPNVDQFMGQKGQKMVSKKFGF